VYVFSPRRAKKHTQAIENTSNQNSHFQYRALLSFWNIGGYAIAPLYHRMHAANRSPLFDKPYAAWYRS
jgi:hypothetical protein